jgi:hypothetical protein
MNDPYVFVLLMDIQNNILLLSYNQYTTFLSTKITKLDQPIGNDPIMASKIASLRLIKEKLNLLTSHERLDDISLYDITGNKLNVYIHRINDDEKKLILTNNTSGANFININNLPSNLDILSSAISQAITSYPNLILNTTKPPSFQPISFSTDIKKYTPFMEVPLLMPLDIYEKNKQNIPIPNQQPVQNKEPVQNQAQEPTQQPVSVPTYRSNLPLNVIVSDKNNSSEKKIPIEASNHNLPLTFIVSDKKGSVVQPPIFHADEIRTTELNINEDNKNLNVEKNDKKCLELENKYLKYKEKYLVAKQDILTQSQKLKEFDEIKEKYLVAKQDILTQSQKLKECDEIKEKYLVMKQKYLELEKELNELKNKK